MPLARLRYESDGGDVLFVEVQANRTAAIGEEPSATATSQQTAYVSVSRRRNGIHARGLILSRVRGTAPDQFTSTTFIPLLTQAAAALEANQPGQSKTIDGTMFTIRSAVPEVVR